MGLALPWDIFHWPDFQVLVHHFAEMHLRGIHLDEYLKQGNKQHGIDLIQRNGAGGRGIAIQCKKEERLSEGNLRALVQEFIDNDYRQSTTTFYLATSADLQTKYLNKWLEEKQQELQKEYHIGFVWWDIHYLERHLKAMWSVVARHFGIDAADRFCYPETRIVPSSKLKPVKDPILRKIAPVTLTHTQEAATWFIPGAKAVDLKDLFTKDRLQTLRICIIAEPYQGKSTYLQQSAFDLSKAGQRIQPVFIDIKKETVRSIEVLLNEKYGAWKTIPLKDIVLILDGMDEAPSARFLEQSRHINTFGETYPDISIVISCRGIFYHQYDLKTELPDFELYQLCPLEPADIEYYSRKRLGDRQATDFQRAVNRNQLSSWLYHPFYLVNLVEKFKEHKSLPDSKQKIIDEFIKKAFQKAGDRVLDNGQKLSSQSHRFRAVVEKLAICMQLMGKNSLSREDFQQFFDDGERELLQHNSLISFHHHTWTFANAFLQEHLAASYLCDKTFKEITDLISVGRETRKIRTKWIQTLHSLLSLLPNDSALFGELLQFMENDSLELIFHTDPSLHTDEFKFNALKKLLRFCRETNIWPLLAPLESIASFMNNVSGTANYLASWICDASCAETTKILCCRILANLSPIDEEEAGLFELVVSQLSTTTNSFYAGELVAVLSAWELGDAGAVRTIMGVNDHSEKHPFRNEMYEWITALGLNNEFWEYGIQGIPVLIAHNQPITQGGSEYRLETFFLTVSDRRQLYPLFQAMGTDEWLNFYRFKGFLKEGFVHQLMEKCAQLYQHDPLIFLPVSQFIQTAGRRYRHSEDSEINQFLNSTQSHHLIVQSLGPIMFSDKAWEFGPLLTPASFDYLVWLFEENTYNPRVLRMPLMGLSRKQAVAEDEYRKIVRAATEGEEFSLADTETYRLIQDADKKRLKNDLKAIQSVDSFRMAVKRYFTLHRKKTIKHVDLFGRSHESRLSIAGSPFILSFLRDWIMSSAKEKATLEDCLHFLANEDAFLYFRATEILEYSIGTEATDRIFRPLIRAYYYSQLPSCQFENTYSLEGNQYFQKNVEDLVGKIFDKYEFPTEPKYLTELIWLDKGNFGQEISAFHAKTETIKDKVMRQLGDDGEFLVSAAVIEHLKAGIRLKSVLATHLALCRSLKITGAKKMVLQILQQQAFDPHNLRWVVDLYLSIGGKKSTLLPILETMSYKEAVFDHLLKTLSDTYAGKVAEIGLAAIDSGQLSKEEELTIAQLLTTMGHLEGFRYQVDHLRDSHRSILRLQTGTGLDKIDTATALDLLKDLMYMTVDPAFTSIRPPENPKYVLHDWLSGLAEKSEEDLLLVIDFLQAAESSLLPRYPGATELKWYQRKLLEKFRGVGERPRSIREIQLFIQHSADNRISLSQAASPAIG
jgi:hypothetical protein